MWVVEKVMRVGVEMKMARTLSGKKEGKVGEEWPKIKNEMKNCSDWTSNNRHKMETEENK